MALKASCLYRDYKTTALIKLETSGALKRRKYGALQRYRRYKLECHLKWAMRGVLRYGRFTHLS